MGTLAFIMGDEFRPCVEKLNEFKTSLFEEVYQKALTIADEYVHGEKGTDDLGVVNDNRNNIVAFIGERGSGKTSCMLSVAHALLKERDKIKNFIPHSKLGDHLFLSVDPIDPSFFDQHSNILDVVIAKMFKSFKRQAEDGRTDCQDARYIQKKRTLIECFQQVKENIDNMQGSAETSCDALDALVSMAAGVDLKQNIYELVESYLDFFTDRQSQKATLLLLIDDIDLHTQHAYQMVEQIRKYLIHPNILILMAVKLDQLETVIRQHYINEFKALIEKKEVSEHFTEEMADRYTEKLIPLERRLYLADMELYMTEKLIVYKNEREAETVSDKEPEGTVREVVLSKIFQKTRFLFYNSGGVTSYIVPRNLRELRNLIRLLEGMEDYKNGGEYAEYNKIIFKKYFFETWVNNNLDADGQHLFETLRSYTDVVKKNKLVITLLRKEYGNFIGNIQNIGGIQHGRLVSQQLSEYDRIIQEQNLVYNISLGDVLAILAVLEQQVVDLPSQKLFFAIRSYYSMMLYEYYDELTDSLKVAPNSVGSSSSLSANSPEILKLEFMRNYSNYEKLVGGSFINSLAYNLLPASSDMREESRAQRVINGEVIFDLIDILKKEVSSSKSDEKIIVYKNEDRRISLKYKDAFWLVEFFILTISRKYDSKRSYRSIDEIYYTSDFYQVRKNLWFDVLSCLFNSIHLERTYNRFDIDFCRLAQQQEWSLYRQIEGAGEKILGYGNAKHAHLSVTCFRNVEILEEVVNYLENHRPKGGGNARILAAFFENLVKFELLTYDKAKDNQSYYLIHFKYLEKVVEFLKYLNLDENRDLNWLFNGIYENVNLKELFEEETVLPPFQWSLKGLYRDDANRRKTIIKRLVGLNPYYATKEVFRNLLEKKFEDEYYFRMEVEEICEEIEKIMKSWTISDLR